MRNPRPHQQQIAAATFDPFGARVQAADTRELQCELARGMEMRVRNGRSSLLDPARKLDATVNRKEPIGPGSELGGKPRV